MGDHRLRHHPRRSTFTAATLRRRLASTILAHAAAIPLAAFEFGFIVRCSSSSYVVYLLRWRTPPMAEVRSGTHVPAREREPRPRRAYGVRGRGGAVSLIKPEISP